MMLYHHCKQQYPSVVFRQKLAPEKVEEVTVVIELHPTRAEDGQVQYEGTKLSGATAFKFTSYWALHGREIYIRALQAMPELDGEPFSLIQRRGNLKIVHRGDGLNFERLIVPSDEEEADALPECDALMRTPPAAKRRLPHKQRADDEGWIAGVKRARGDK